MITCSTTASFLAAALLVMMPMSSSATAGEPLIALKPTTKAKPAFSVNVSDDVLQLACSLDGKLLVAGTRSSELVVWDKPFEKSPRVIQSKGKGSITSVTISPDCKHIAATSWWDQHLRVFESATGRQLVAVDCGHGLTQACFSPNGKMLATSGNMIVSSGRDEVASTLELRDPHTGKLVEILKGEESEEFTRFGFHPKGDVLAIGCRSGKVQLWSLKTRKLLATADAHLKAVTDVSFSSDGKALASAGLDGQAILWMVTPLNTLPRKDESEIKLVRSHTLKTPFETLAKVAWSSKGTHIVVSCYAAGHRGRRCTNISIWETKSGKEISNLGDGENGHGGFTATFCPHDEYVFCGDARSRVCAWRFASLLGMN